MVQALRRREAGAEAIAMATIGGTGFDASEFLDKARRVARMAGGPLEFSRAPAGLTNFDHESEDIGRERDDDQDDPAAGRLPQRTEADDRAG